MTVDTAESDTVEDFTNNVEKMVDDSCTLIIGVGFHLEPAIHESALKHTDRNYALIDSGFSDGTNPVVLENGRPLLFNTSEAAYLAGYASAAMTKTGKVATFGGAQIPRRDRVHGRICRRRERLQPGQGRLRAGAGLG